MTVLFMKELLKQNGVLKLGVFALTTAVPAALVVSYGVFLAYLFISGGSKFQDAGYFLALAFIFFGVNSKDFFGNNRDGTLLPKHIIMLCSVPFVIFYDSRIDDGLFFGLMFLYLISNAYFVNVKSTGFYWQYEADSKNFSTEDVSRALRKHFFLVKTKQNDKSALIEGFGLWAIRSTVKMQDGRIRVRVEPMLSGITFFLFLKVVPAPLGEFYGKRVLKDLGLSLETSKVEG